MAFPDDPGTDYPDSARLLAVGDLHLGRGVAGLDLSPEDRAELPETARLGPAAAWFRICTHAVKLAVDAVLLAGDVIDRAENRFEAVAQLKRGLDLLQRNAIPCLAVAGNHDAELLPLIIDRLSPLELLGRDGRWACRPLETRAGTIQIVGWSFPQHQVSHSPLDHFNPALINSECPAIGLLHADLDAAASPYAPVRSAALHDTGLHVWLLGHLHKPSDLSREPIGYLGSALGLDPTETGARGPWLVRVPRHGPVRCEHVVLAPLFRATPTLDLSTVPAADDTADPLAPVEAALARLLKHHIQAACEKAAMRPELVALRVTLAGRRAGHHRLAARLPELRGLRDFADGVPGIITDCADHSHEPIDLESLAASLTPAGILAKSLLTLEQADMASPPWRDLRHYLAEYGRQADWSDAHERWSSPDPDRLRTLGLQAGYRRLEALLSQRAERVS